MNAEAALMSTIGRQLAARHQYLSSQMSKKKGKNHFSNFAAKVTEI